MSKDKDYLEAIEGAERRFFSGPVEFRESGEGSGEIEGIAAKVGTTYDMGWYNEEILEGAFDEALGSDIRCLFNHNPNKILARTNSGTLKVSLSPEGHLMYKYKTPERQYAKDLEDAVRTGDVDQSSWGFTIKEQRWVERDGEPDLRQVVKADIIYDVSPVTYPANPDTTVAKRSFEAMREGKEADRVDKQHRSRKLRLNEIKLNEKR